MRDKDTILKDDGSDELSEDEFKKAEAKHYADKIAYLNKSDDQLIAEIYDYGHKGGAAQVEQRKAMLQSRLKDSINQLRTAVNVANQSSSRYNTRLLWLTVAMFIVAILQFLF